MIDPNKRERERDWAIDMYSPQQAVKSACVFEIVEYKAFISTSYKPDQYLDLNHQD
jgi:hypothetical protein